MSRLDQTIARLQAQKICIEAAATALVQTPGVIFELGLGSGRTFDHLREVFPDRSIIVFERVVETAAAYTPAADQLILGEVLTTLPQAVSQFAASVALIHADIGGPDHQANAHLAESLSQHYSRFLVAGGWLIANRAEAAFAGSTPIALPTTVADDHCYLFRSA